MPRVFILLGVLLFVAGAALGTWWFAIRGEPLPFMGGQGQETAQSDGKGEGSVTFVEMKPISVPVMNDGTAVRILSVVVSVQLRQGATEVLNTHKTELRDAFIEQLHGLYSLDYVREHKNRSKIVRRRLVRVARRIIGDAVQTVFIKAVSRRETNS